MTVLATSDMHGMFDGLCLDGIDLALFAGDIAALHRRGPWHVYDQIKWMRKDFANFCSSYVLGLLSFNSNCWYNGD